MDAEWQTRHGANPAQSDTLRKRGERYGVGIYQGLESGDFFFWLDGRWSRPYDTIDQAQAAVGGFVAGQRHALEA